MATMGGERVFVDTNVLVHAAVPTSPVHASARNALRSLHGARAELWISRQVIREYLAVLSRTQTYARPVPMAALVEDCQRFEQTFKVAHETNAVTRVLLEIVQSAVVAGKQVHDASIVATIRSYGIRKLLAHNADDFKRFSDLITVLVL